MSTPANAKERYSAAFVQAITEEAMIPFIDDLLGKGLVEINQELGPRKYSALHMAAMNGGRKMIEFLLARGAKIEHPEPTSGMTALHIALFREKGQDIAKTLIEKGANITTPGKEGVSPFFLMLHKYDYSLIKRALSFSKDPTEVVNTRISKSSSPPPLNQSTPLTPLEFVILRREGAQLDAIVELLLSNGANPTLCHHQPLLLAAAARNDAATLRVLLKHGITNGLDDAIAQIRDLGTQGTDVKDAARVLLEEQDRQRAAAATEMAGKLLKLGAALRDDDDTMPELFEGWKTEQAGAATGVRGDYAGMPELEEVQAAKKPDPKPQAPQAKTAARKGSEKAK